MKYRVILLVSFAVMLSTGVVSQQQQVKQAQKSKKPEKLAFKKDIQPIIRKYCLPCHSEEEMNPSELYMETYEQIIEGGKHGSPIVPGAADSSLLIEKMLPKPPFGDPMPLKRKKPFPADTLNMLKTWINQGAKKN